MGIFSCLTTAKQRNLNENLNEKVKPKVEEWWNYRLKSSYKIVDVRQ